MIPNSYGRQQNTHNAVPHMPEPAVGTVMGQLTQLPSGLFRMGVAINISSESIYYLNCPRTFGSHLVTIIFMQMCTMPRLCFMQSLLTVGC